MKNGDFSIVMLVYQRVSLGDKHALISYQVMEIFQHNLGLGLDLQGSAMWKRNL